MLLPRPANLIVVGGKSNCRLTQVGSPSLQLDTLRLKVVKIGGRVVQWADQVRLCLASSHPGQLLWQLLARHRFVNNPG